MCAKSNYSNNLYNDFETLFYENERLTKNNKILLLRATVAEDEQRRLEQVIIKKDEIITKKDEEILELKKKIGQLEVKENLDGTNSGIPTSQTPINKKKIIPNFAKNTGGKIGRKQGHTKDKLHKLPDEKINKQVNHTLEVCPNCDNKDLVPTGKVISKDEIDYKIIVYNTRHNYIEYKCSCCGKIVHELIPNYLKEECQYGSTVKDLILTLTNIGNVPFNKTRRILTGLSMNEITPTEGYIAKLQKVSSKTLNNFIEELHNHATKESLIYWDDTVIMVNKNQSCMRYYGNDSFCLFKAHEKKNKDGLDKDNILNQLSSNTVVEHDHNKVNYNEDYSYINAECCQHLLRDLKKVEINIPERTWCKEAIELFQTFDHKRNELISKNIDRFTDDEINNFIQKLDEILLKGIEENEKDNKPYYAEKEQTLIYRIIEYRDNYIYWILDFSLPFTNNLSERNLRGIKSKMKVSGQFQNIDRAIDYANIRSYIETCRLYGKNEYDCLSRLIEYKPYTFAELIASKKEC